MRIQCRSPRCRIFVRRQKRPEFFAFAPPLGWYWFGKDLGNAAPADVFYEDALLVLRRVAVLLLQLPNEANRRDVVAELLLE